MTEFERTFEQRNGLIEAMKMVSDAVQIVMTKHRAPESLEIMASLGAYEVLEEFSKLYSERYNRLGG